MIDRDFDLLHTLALRLIDPRYRHRADYPRSWPTGPANLLVGRLPDGYPIPVPDTCRILGSLVFPHHSQVVLDSPLSPKKVLAFYMERLPADGWTALHHAGNMWNGFQSHHQPDAILGQFARGPAEPALNVLAQTHDGSVDVRLYLTTQIPDPAPSLRRSLGEGGPRPLDSCIPGLTAPPRARVRHEGGQFTPVAADSLARLVSELDLPAVALHYTEQPGDAGWTVTDESQDGTVAWSRWRFHYRGHAYRAIMVIVNISSGRYYSQIHARQDPLPAGSDWGWDLAE